MSNDVLQEVLVEFIEVWLHNVIYKANIYPTQIFRSRYKYSVSVKQSTFPPLNNYIRTLVLSLRPQLCQQAIQSITINILHDLEIQESYSLNISFPGKPTVDSDDTPEKIVSRCKDAFRGHIVSVLNTCSKEGEEPNENRTFSVSVRTSELAGSQMTGWCGESVVELNVTTVLTPLLFCDVGMVRLQSTHRL